MTIAVSIEQFDQSHFQHLSALFGSYYRPGDRLLTAAYTEWLYAQNPFGRARMVIAQEDGDWIGFMAMIPVQLVRRNGRLLAYYVVNVLVHPQQQGRHILGRMITAAKSFATAEGACMMGHPNHMSYKFFLRAKMHFHDPLKASLVLPRIIHRGLRAVDLVSPEQLCPLLPALASEAAGFAHWSVVLSEDYLLWRYLRHPTNRYRVQLVFAGSVPAGLMVTKRVRPGISLLVDQFLLEQHRAAALACLPWFTVSFRADASASESRATFLPLRFIKKQLRFFFTDFQQPVAAGDLMNLGLSASDF